MTSTTTRDTHVLRHGTDFRQFVIYNKEFKYYPF